mgnify:CR=1 FL=1
MGENSINNLFSYQVLVLCCGYILGASSEIWSINAMKSVYNIDFAIFAALLLNSYWPIQTILYYNLSKKQLTKRIITKDMKQSYLILGFLSAAVSLTRCYGIVNLPAILYVISSNTEIVWESMMTYFILGRNIDSYQLTAVLFVILGVIISLYDPKTGTLGDPKEHTDDRRQILIGLGLSCISRFLSSLNTILAERYVCIVSVSCI